MANGDSGNQEQRAPAARMDLAQVLAPLSPAQFFGDYWEQRHWLLQRRQPDYYRDLLTAQDLERIIADTDVRYPAIRLARGGGFYPPEAYTHNVKFGDETFIGVPDLRRIAAEYRAGATVTLPALHRSWRPLELLCSDIEARLDHAAHANVYITPGNAAGFTPHYDVHEVLVLQVAGTKTWSIYPPPIALPHRTQLFAPEAYSTPEPLAQVELTAGDLLYLPRGYVHSTMTSHSFSAHITVGIAVYTWVDLAREALQSCIDSPDLRRALPPGFASRPELGPVLKTRLREMLGQLQGEVDPEKLIDGFSRRVRASHRRRPEAFRADVQVIDAEVPLTVATAKLPRLVQEGTQTILDFQGHRYALAAASVSTVRTMMQRSAFRTSDLPGPLDPEARLALSRYLYDIGFLLTQR